MTPRHHLPALAILLSPCWLAPTLAFLLSSCGLEGHAFMGLVEGVEEYMDFPLDCLDLLPFIFFVNAMVALLLQPFLAALRRLYAACFRFPLKLIGKQHLLTESAHLLASSVAWLGFACGLCLFPLVFALYGDTFHPHIGGPLNPGSAIAGALCSLVLMAAVTLITTMWTLFSWQQLHRVGKKNPVADCIARQSKGATQCLLSLLLLLLLLLLPACKPEVRMLACEDFEENCNISGHGKEILALRDHYLQTEDARYATEKHRITMLHVAADSQRLWLVNKLLADGADPNARMERPQPCEEGNMEAGDTPALLAVRAGRRMSNSDALLIIRALVERGANLNLPGFDGEHILHACNDMYGHPSSDDSLSSGGSLAVELMKLGARGDATFAKKAIREGWPQALEALFNTAEGEAIRQHMPELLQESAHSFETAEGQLECARILLQHATPQELCGTPENSPLFTLCKEMEADASYADVAGCADYVALLLRHGANPLLPGGEFRRTCAADYMALHPGLQEALQQRGITVAPPPHHFTPETLVEQLLDIPTEAVSVEETRAQLDCIASVFTAPTEAMLAQKLLYRQACSKALRLLHRAADSGQDAALLMTHPAWTQASAWEGEADAARGLLLALRDNPEVILPRHELVAAARHMLQEGKPAVAHAFILLLVRDKEAAPLIEELCADSTPLPLRAAAWSCKLQQHDLKQTSRTSWCRHQGLPTLGEITEWLTREHYLSEDVEEQYPILSPVVAAERSAPCLSKLAPLTSPERLFYETDGSEGECTQPDEQEVQKRVAALRRLGAPLAARLCGDKTPTEPATEVVELKERYGMATAASLELELACSRYVWKNQDAFREPMKYHKEEEDAAPERD